MNDKKNLILGVIIVLALGGAVYFWTSSSGSSRPPEAPGPIVTAPASASDVDSGAEAVTRGGGEGFDDERPDIAQEPETETAAAPDRPDRPGMSKKRTRRRSDRDNGDLEEEEVDDRPVKKARSFPG